MDYRIAKDWASRNRNVLFFVGGFLFDVFTLVRIDSLLDLIYQSTYLGLITLILVRQFRYELGIWRPTGWVARLWHFETEAIHFCYGGLLSAYVILYFKSTTGPRSMVFLLLVLLLMFANEMPQVKAAGSKMRLGLHAFCLVSYLNYLIPILVGRMGGWTFALAVLLTGLCSYYLVRHLARLTRIVEIRRHPGENRGPETSEPWIPGLQAAGDPARREFGGPASAGMTTQDPVVSERATAIALGWPPAVLLLLVIALYVLKWIPPVPLSMQYGGIYHQVSREGDRYKLASPKPPWYRFWQHDSRIFLARPGDAIFCFVRVFAPRRFTHRIFLVWEKEDRENNTFITTDRFPLPIVGGRGEGYRGYGAKSRYEPGRWRVLIETEDGRTIGSVRFRVEPDSKTSERAWRSRSM